MHANIIISALGFADAFFRSMWHFLCIAQIPQVPTLIFFLVFSSKRPKMRKCFLATSFMQKIKIIIKSVWDPGNLRLFLTPDHQKLILKSVFWLLSPIFSSRIFGGWTDVIFWYNKLSFLIYTAEKTAWFNFEKLWKIGNYIHTAMLWERGR